MIIYFAAHLFFYTLLVCCQFPLYEKAFFVFFLIGVLVLQNLFYFVCAFKDAGQIKRS